MKLPTHSPRAILIIAAIISSALIMLSVFVAMFLDGTTGQIVAILMSSIGSTILFPIGVSYVYDRLREQWFGDEVWRIFNELADAGIIRVYKDREFVEGRENAQSRLSKHFIQSTQGEIRLIGASLRVFFNPLGPFYKDIDTMLCSNGVTVQALVNHPDSPEAANRTRTEEPDLKPGTTAQSRRDLDSTLVNIDNLRTLHGDRIEVRQYLEAPYCTAAIFPDVCYYSPNLISPEVPVRLPLLIFRRGSHAYNMIESSFKEIWSSPSTVGSGGSPSNTKNGKPNG